MRTLNLALVSVSLCATLIAAQVPSPDTGLSPSLDRLFQEGLEAQRSNNTSQAMQKYHEVVEQAPTFAPAWFDLGLVFDEQGDSAQALDSFERALRLAPDYPHLHMFLGIENVRLGHPEQGVVDLSKATQENPADKQSWFWCARAYLLLHQDGLALIAAQHAGEAAPDDPSVEFLTATILGDEQKWIGSDQILSQLARLYPVLPYIHEQLAENDFQQARIDDAIAEFKSELEIDPENLKAQAMIGMILCDRSDYAAAVPFLTAAAQNGNDDPAVQLKLAESLWHLGEFNNALPHAQVAARLAPDNSTAHFILWKLYLALGDQANAGREMASLKALFGK